MQPQPNAEILENPIFTLWIGEDGILCFISKKHPAQTIEDSKRLFADINKISGGQKKCMLMDLTNFHLPTRESREYGAIEIPKMAIAIAFLSRSVLGAMVANIFFKLKRQPYPTKMFVDENEAREWLKNYL
jgi:hypothetical protein